MQTPGLTIRIGEAEFTGRRFRWEPGVYIRTFTGVRGGGATTFDSISTGIGVVDTVNRRDTPRIITISGFIYERSEWALQRRIDQLSSLLAEDDESATLHWQVNGEGRRTRVRRHSWAEPVRRAGEHPFADFSLSFRASDQRIYSSTRQATPWGVEVPVKNRGGYPAPVVAEVRGSSPNGYVLYGPRERAVVVTRAINPGSTHRYHGDTGLLEVDGVPQTSGVNRSDRMAIPKGAFTFVVTNGCQLRILWADTWVP